jgi:hypothetical protein
VIAEDEPGIEEPPVHRRNTERTEAGVIERNTAAEGVEHGDVVRRPGL